MINMLGVLRLRGKTKVKKEVQDTLNMIGLRKVNTLAILPHSEIVKGMIKKVDQYVTWGEVSEETIKSLRKRGDETVFHLKPPEKGFKSLKKMYPEGDLGYRGDRLDELIKRMI